MDDRLDRDKVRQAHAEYDNTRCAAWLIATGNRPTSGVTEVTLFKTPQTVYKAAAPRPGFGCDIHRSTE